MTALGFTVTFHGPFRVGAAYARDGIDAALDRDDPLPADHLKGVMRAAAATLLGHRHPRLAEVFGSPRVASLWSWTSATADDWRFGRNYRVEIDPDKHSAIKDHLVFGEQAWPATASFTVTRHSANPDDVHVLILRCAASAVHGLGAWRRRGLGWVGITPDDGLVTAEEAAAIIAMRSNR